MLVSLSGGHIDIFRFTWRQWGICEITRFVIIVFDTQARQVADANAQSTAVIVDVLAIQNGFGMLGRMGIDILNEGLSKEDYKKNVK